jgi:hypothetical protein
MSAQIMNSLPSFIFRESSVYYMCISIYIIELFFLNIALKQRNNPLNIRTISYLDSSAVKKIYDLMKGPA